MNFSSVKAAGNPLSDKDDITAKKSLIAVLEPLEFLFAKSFTIADNLWFSMIVINGLETVEILKVFLIEI